MPGKDEKLKRKAVLRALAEENQSGADGPAGPISLLDLGDLFDCLDVYVGDSGCDDTLVCTRQFLKDRGLDASAILPWLAEGGGYCDCEVLANVEEAWEDSIREAREALHQMASTSLQREPPPPIQNA